MWVSPWCCAKVRSNMRQTNESARLLVALPASGGVVLSLRERPPLSLLPRLPRPLRPPRNPANKLAA